MIPLEWADRRLRGPSNSATRPQEGDNAGVCAETIYAQMKNYLQFFGKSTGKVVKKR